MFVQIIVYGGPKWSPLFSGILSFFFSKEISKSFLQYIENFYHIQ
jgi:hypothetical protein